MRALALCLLCAPYLQGGVVKLLDFPAAVAEMAHFGLQPAPLMACAVIALELGAPLLILLRRWRWQAALALALFTAAASVLANAFWQSGGEPRMAQMNAFFEHVGLVGGLLLLAWMDRRERSA